MAVKGVFASESGIQGSRVGDFASALLQTMPTGSAPLLALTSGMQSAGATDTVITWFEENHMSGRINLTSNAGTGTSFTMDDISGVIAGQIYMIESSGEYVYVDSVSGSVATMTRGFASTSIVSKDGSGTAVPLQLISNANEEGSARPTAIANLGFPRFNYMQIFRNAWDVTGTLKAVEFHTGDPVAKNKRDAALFHSESIERALIWGKKTIGIMNSKPFRTMDGIVTQAIAAGATTKAESSNTKWGDIDAFLLSVFSTNIKGQPNERIVFTDNTVVSVLNKIARLDSVIELSPGATEYGLKVTKWMTPYGDISLMTHPLMNEAQAWRGSMYVLHPGAIRTRYLRKTAEDPYDVNGSRAGVDGDFGVITTEMSCEYKAGITAGIYTGISTAAAA